MKMVILLSLSGSIALSSGILILKITGRLTSVRWQDMWAKMTLAFYLISGFLVIGIRHIIKKLHILERADEENYIFLSHKAAGILKYDAGIRMNRIFILYIMVTFAAVLIMLVLFIRKLCEYWKIEGMVAAGNAFKKADIPDAEIDRLKSMIGLKRKVQVFLTDMSSGAFTAGYFHPVIVLQDEPVPEKREVILLHELCHIKRRDSLFRLIAMAAVCVHWFNPLVYFLPEMLNRSSELSCDEMVIRHLSPEQKKIYIQEIISQSRAVQKRESMPVRLGGNGNLTRERVINMMNENKSNSRVSKCLMVVLTVIMLAVSSLPVCAYEGVTVFEIDGNEELNCQPGVNISDGDYLFAADDSLLFDAGYTEIRFDQQFVDEDGNIYEVNLNENGRAGCTHPTLVPGTYQNHVKNSSGGCVVSNYSSNRCKDCGKIFLGNLISENKFPVCIH